MFADETSLLAVTVVVRALVAPGGNGFGGYNFGISTKLQSTISKKQTTTTMIDVRSMKINAGERFFAPANHSMLENAVPCPAQDLRHNHPTDDTGQSVSAPAMCPMTHHDFVWPPTHIANNLD